MTCTKIWVHTGKFVLWVTIMLKWMCMCLNMCIYCRSKGVICAKRLSAKTEGKGGGKKGGMASLRIKFTACSSVYIYQITISLSLPSPRQKHSKREMDTCTFKCYSIFFMFKILKYWWVGWVFNFTNIESCVTEYILSCTVNCRKKWHWWKC